MTKLLLSAFLTAMIIGGLALVGVLQFDTVQASTDVSGIINTDITWTKADSPYTLTGNVLVDVGATLTIEPGVTVSFTSYFMNIGGTLYAKGSETEEIIMTGTSISYPGEWKGRLVFLSTSINSTVEYTQITSTPNTIIGIFSSPTLTHNVIIGTTGDAISIIDGSPIISANIIANNGGNGILIDATSSTSVCSPRIRQNIVANNTGSGIAVKHGAVSVEKNNITNNGDGIYDEEWWGYDSANFSENIISGNSIGLHLRFFAYGSVYSATNNLIINNNNAIQIETTFQGMGSGGAGNISNNTISANTNAVVITCPLQLTMNYNNINNNGFNVRLNSVSNINTTHNWWGTINATTISESIYDFYDDFNLGKADFNPFLTESNPAAPVIPTFAISASAGTGGSVNPSGNVTVNYGSSQTFTVMPNSGYQMVSVLMDGKPATAPYTFNNVVADGHTISATFEPTPVIPEFPSVTILALLVTATLAVAVGFRRKSQTEPLT